MRSRRSQQQNQRRRGSVNSVISEEVADRFMRLPRNTLTARPAHRRARGIDAVLVALDKKVQLGLRQLCFERMEIEARRAAVLMRLDAAGHREGDREPDVLVRLNTQLADNDYNIRWLAKGAAPVLLEALQDPEVRASLALPVASEEDAANGEGGGSPSEEDPRVWRRRLETRKITRLDAPYRRVTHDSPDVRGNRSLTNELNSKRPEDGLSYYQKQTLRYGPARRGSTSIAGERCGFALFLCDAWGYVSHGAVWRCRVVGGYASCAISPAVFLCARMTYPPSAYRVCFLLSLCSPSAHLPVYQQVSWYRLAHRVCIPLLSRIMLPTNSAHRRRLGGFI